MTADQKYFENFFSEKNLPERMFEVESANGTTNMISSEIVIEAIKTTGAQEQREIRNMLMKIDFDGCGDVRLYRSRFIFLEREGKLGFRGSTGNKIAHDAGMAVLNSLGGIDNA